MRRGRGLWFGDTAPKRDSGWVSIKHYTKTPVALQPRERNETAQKGLIGFDIGIYVLPTEEGVIEDIGDSDQRYYIAEEHIDMPGYNSL